MKVILHSLFLIITILQAACNMAKYCLEIIILNFNQSDSTFFIFLMTILPPRCNMAY